MSRQGVPDSQDIPCDLIADGVAERASPRRPIDGDRVEKGGEQGLAGVPLAGRILRDWPEQKPRDVPDDRLTGADSWLSHGGGRSRRRPPRGIAALTEFGE